MLTPIRGNGPLAGGGAARRAAGHFVLPESGLAGETVSVGAPTGLAGLIGLQQALSDAERDAAARGRGQALLAELEGLQRGLLAGGVDPHRLSRLAMLAEGEAGADPALQTLLRALSLRARIELERLPDEGRRSDRNLPAPGSPIG